MLPFLILAALLIAPTAAAAASDRRRSRSNDEDDDDCSSRGSSSSGFSHLAGSIPSYTPPKFEALRPFGLGNRESQTETKYPWLNSSKLTAGLNLEPSATSFAFQVSKPTLPKFEPLALSHSLFADREDAPSDSLSWLNRKSASWEIPKPIEMPKISHTSVGDLFKEVTPSPSLHWEPPWYRDQFRQEQARQRAEGQAILDRVAAQREAWSRNGLC